MYLDTDEEYIFNYLSGNLSAVDEKSFNMWLDESEDRRVLFKKCCKEYYRIQWSYRLDEVVDTDSFLRIRERLRRERRIQIFKYVALIVLLLTIGGSLFLFKPSSHSSIVAAVDDGIFRINANKPILTLSSGKQIILSTDTLNEPLLNKIDIISRDSNSFMHKINLNSNYNKLTIPRGCEFYLTLSDGSRVWLNAGSELKYPGVFGKEERKVYLSGEAYFEIVQDSTSPFKVYASGMELEVLGTSFNVQAYEDEDVITTTLVTGKIVQYYPVIHEKIVLEPSTQSVYNSSLGILKTQKADIQEAVAWKDAKIIARNQRLDDILRILSRWYDFEVIYENPELRDIRFHLHSNRFENIRMILDILQATNGIHVRYQGNRIYISK